MQILAMKQSVVKAKDLLKYGKECRSCKFHVRAFTVNDELFYRCACESRFVKRLVKSVASLYDMPLPKERICQYWQ